MKHPCSGCLYYTDTTGSWMSVCNKCKKGITMPTMHDSNEGQTQHELPQLTEAMIDAPRHFLLGLELGIKNLKPMREHLVLCGCNYSCWPEWAKTEDGHITKAGKAILIYTMMEAEK